MRKIHSYLYLLSIILMGLIIYSSDEVIASFIKLPSSEFKLIQNELKSNYAMDLESKTRNYNPISGNIYLYESNLSSEHNMANISSIKLTGSMFDRRKIKEIYMENGRLTLSNSSNQTEKLLQISSKFTQENLPNIHVKNITLANSQNHIKYIKSIKDTNFLTRMLGKADHLIKFFSKEKNHMVSDSENSFKSEIILDGKTLNITIGLDKLTENSSMLKSNFNISGTQATFTGKINSDNNITDGVFYITTSNDFLLAQAEKDNINLVGKYELANKKLKLYDIGIKANSIKNALIEAEIDYSDNIKFNLVSKIENLILPKNNLIYSSKLENCESVNKMITSLQEQFKKIMMKNKMLPEVNLSIQIKSILNEDKEIMNNLNLLTSYGDNQIIIEKLTAFIGKDNFNFSGKITHNNIRPLLEGEISAQFFEIPGLSDEKLKNNYISGRFYLTDKEMRLYKLKINNEFLKNTVLQTNIIFKNTHALRVDFVNKISNLKLENIDFIKNAIDQFQEAIFKEEKRKELFLSYSRNKVNYDIEFDLENIELGNYYMDKLNIALNLNKGIGFLHNFEVTNQYNKGKINASLDLRGIEPQIFVNIQAEKIDNNLIDKINIFKNENGNYLIPDFSNFNMNLVGKINQMNLKDKYEDVIFNSNIKDRLLSINKLDFKAFSGQNSLVGKISLSNYISMAMGYKLNNLSFQSFIRNFFPVNNLDLRFSASGNLSSYGSSNKEITDNLNINANFIGSRMEVRNLDLPLIIQSRQQGLIRRDNVDELTKAANETVKNSIIRNIKGNLSGERGNINFKDVTYEIEDGVFGETSGILNLPSLKIELENNIYFGRLNSRRDDNQFSIKIFGDMKELNRSINLSNIVRR